MQSGERQQQKIAVDTMESSPPSFMVPVAPAAGDDALSVASPPAGKR